MTVDTLNILIHSSLLQHNWKYWKWYLIPKSALYCSAYTVFKKGKMNRFVILCILWYYASRFNSVILLDLDTFAWKSNYVIKSIFFLPLARHRSLALVQNSHFWSQLNKVWLHFFFPLCPLLLRELSVKGTAWIPFRLYSQLCSRQGLLSVFKITRRTDAVLLICFFCMQSAAVKRISRLAHL